MVCGQVANEMNSSCVVVIVDPVNVGVISEQLTSKELNFNLHHQAVFATTDRLTTADGLVDKRPSPYHQVNISHLH
jgi:hypothetical protein